MGEIPVQQTNPAKTHENTLWVLTEVYYPDEISTGYYLTSIAEGIAADRDVKAITGQPKPL